MQATALVANLAAAAVFSALPLLSHAAEQGGVKPPDKIILEVGDHEMVDLVEKMAELLGENHLVDGGWAQFAKMRGSGRYAVHLQKRMELDARSSREVIPELLYTLGWVLTPVDEARGIHEWININGRRRADIRSRASYLDRDEVLASARSHRYVITSLALKNVEVKDVAPALTALAKDNKMLELLPVTGETNSIIVGGLGVHVVPMVELIKQLDRRQRQRPSEAKGDKGGE